MKLAAVGVGGAGSRIVNRIVDVERTAGRRLTVGNTLLVNTARPGFDVTEHVPEDRRVTIGDTRRNRDGQGVDGDPDVAAEVAREERTHIVRALDAIEFHEVDGVLVAAGLGGATGGGAGAAVIDHLTSICDEPVYALAALPSREEGEAPALNAARSLQSFVTGADNVIAFDNEAWGPADDATEREDGASGYGAANVALAERVVTLFATGGGDGVPENRLDPSDITRTLETGGISSIGYASTDVPSANPVVGWLRSWRDRLPWTADPEEEPTDAARIDGLVRRAARSKLTLPCSIASAERALIVLSGPPRSLSRKGFESGRYWLETETDTVDVMAGDEPDDGSSTLTAAVLFSNVTDVDRIDAMQEQAVGAVRSATADGGMVFDAADQR